MSEEKRLLKLTKSEYDELMRLMLTYSATTDYILKMIDKLSKRLDEIER